MALWTHQQRDDAPSSKIEIEKLKTVFKKKKIAFKIVVRASSILVSVGLIRLSNQH